ncbi:MAG TPA: class II fructose-bisphosphate aldolase [Solirubrobacteraceae bacterium]|nr:class II fructose-bisphosphate aldolase [Solirubrobacteraceae bacterium]
MIATREQYAAMLDAASAAGYALAAVNVTSSETLNGAMRGFAEAGADGIVQITTGAAEFLSGGAVKDMALGARALAEYARVLGERYPVAIALHTDHAPPQRFDAFVRPLIDESRRRVAAGGEPLFQSHMFDGSTLPHEENLRVSALLLDELAPLGVVLEVESGVVGGEEDGIAGPQANNRGLYTTIDELMRVAEVLGTGDRGRYLLAATFGNVHGVYAPGHVQLRPEVLREGQDALAAAHAGARFQYVFHGSSGSRPDEVHQAIANGVVKVNLDTDAQYAFTRAVADHVFANYDGVLRIDGHVGRKAAYDPRSWGRKAEAALAARVAEATELFGSSSRSVLR